MNSRKRFHKKIKIKKTIIYIKKMKLNGNKTNVPKYFQKVFFFFFKFIKNKTPTIIRPVHCSTDPQDSQQSQLLRTKSEQSVYIIMSNGHKLWEKLFPRFSRMESTPKASFSVYNILSMLSFQAVFPCPLQVKHFQYCTVLRPTIK